ncbi:MAG: hypothetical protein ACRC50_12295, partial [Gaiella sp.]
MRNTALGPPRVYWAGMLVALAIGLALTGAGSAVSSTERSSGPSVAHDRLVFVSTRTGIGQLYVYDLATRRLGQLTVGYPASAPPDDGSITWARVAPGGGSIAAIKSW